MNLKPIRDYLIVSREEQETTTPGGLYIPTTIENKIITGTVLAVGSGRVTMNGSVVPLDVKVGDKVSFKRSLAEEVKDKRETYLLLREDGVLCVHAS